MVGDTFCVMDLKYFDKTFQKWIESKNSSPPNDDYLGATFRRFIPIFLRFGFWISILQRAFRKLAARVEIGRWASSIGRMEI